MKRLSIVIKFSQITSLIALDIKCLNLFSSHSSAEINIEIFNKYVEYTINNPVIIDNLKKVGLKFPEIDLIRVINSVNK